MIDLAKEKKVWEALDMEIVTAEGLYYLSISGRHYGGLSRRQDIAALAGCISGAYQRGEDDRELEIRGAMTGER